MVVDVSGANALVTEPQRECGLVDPGPSQLDGAAVAKDVRGRFLAEEGRAGLGGCRAVLGEEAFDGISAELSAPAGREERLERLALSFSQPGSERRHGRGRQRRDPLLAALAEAAHVGTAAECHVLASQPDQLRDPQAGLDRDEQQGVVAPTDPAGAVGTGQEGVDLVLGQELHDGAFGALGRYIKDTCDEGTRCRKVA